MSEFNGFSEFEDMDPEEVVRVYIKAFNGPPWNEVSKCADPEVPQRCPRGMSALAVGSVCETCDQTLTEPAFDPEEVALKLEKLSTSRSSLWYQERSEEGLQMFAFAWVATPEDIALEKYSDVPEMKDWLVDRLGDKPIIWLDEVAKDRDIRDKGNLDNFRSICEGYMERFGVSTIAYRTLNKAMTRVAERDFGDDAKIDYANKEVPDSRNFVVIRGV